MQYHPTSRRKRTYVAFAAALLLGPTTAIAGETVPVPADSDLGAAIEDELLEDPAVPSYKIDVTATNGIVTLHGTVPDLRARERAVRLAESIRGVRSVIDDLAVDAPERSDQAVREDVSRALLFDPATDSYELDVAVDDQEVSLKGTVDSWQERRLAEAVAKSVRGVTDVHNRIDVDYRTDRPDLEIAAEVKRTLRWDVLVDDAMIDVTCQEGVVQLSGTVGSAAEKREAAADAWVAGTRSVDTSGLEVARWARDEELRRDKYVGKSDEDIEAAIQDSFLYDPRVSSFEVMADSDAGVVTLRGTVEDLGARRAALEDARNTVGVWRVKNRIKVRPVLTPTDATMKEDVVAALRRDPTVDRYEVSVSVDHGVVTLSGTVDSWYEKAQADDIASRAAGVMGVNNNLVVTDHFVTYGFDPYTDRHDLYQYPWFLTPPATLPRESDWEILEDIREELWWSPFVDADQVTVTMEDGVATLTGTVDTWKERQAAAENALEGGAIAVDNDLHVDYGPAYYQEDGNA